MLRASLAGVLAAAFGVAGCGDAEPPAWATSNGAPAAPAPTSSSTTPLPALFANPVKRSAALPISGGTLLVTQDGKTAVAADPDRDAIFLVDLATRTMRSVATPPGDALGRVVEGPAGTVFVAARRGGVVLAVDIATASVKSRIAACNAPSGLAFDAAQNRLWIACRSGTLLTLDTTSNTVVAKVALDEDLRDVVLVNGAPVVTRFRSAEVLRLTASGAVSDRLLAPTMGGAPAAAHRVVALGGSLLLLANQTESTNPLGTGLGAYYGSGCLGGAVVQQELSLVEVDAASPVAAAGYSESASKSIAMSSRVVVGAVGPVDLAVSPNRDRVVVVATGNAWPVADTLPTLFVASLDVSSGQPPSTYLQSPCNPDPNVAKHASGEPVAVAFDSAGHYLVQSREPATLEFEDGTLVPLSTESHFDTGLALFHMNSGAGISCASCHPEGNEDGHTWSFSAVGLRRTQALQGGVDERAPFHWSGDLATFDDLFGEVMMKRMALPSQPPEEAVQALAGWLDTIPAFAPADDLDPALVARGSVLFSDATTACATCHSGPAYSDNKLHDVGTGGTFVTPALAGVGLRTPIMHDGCAATLRDRFGACGGKNHGVVAQLSPADIDALVAFMRSL